MERECKIHGRTEFAMEGRGYWRCKKCRSGRVVLYRQKLKADLVAKLGGRCSRCGYSRSPWALHFHHTDRTTKDNSVSELVSRASRALAFAEAEKCILLCANCHAEIEHEGWSSST